MAVDPRIQAILDAPLTTPTDLRFDPLRGHASSPGTGPVGEFCRSCRHRSPTDSTYRVWVCERVPRDRADRGTPISLNEDACGRWEEWRRQEARLMNKRRPSIPPGQFAFTFDPPAPARAESSLAGLGREIAATVALILKEDGRSRFEIAGKVSELLDDDVSKSMLDAYASEAKESHAISAERLLALVAVTDRHDLLDRLTRRIGAALLVGEEILTAEIGHIDRQIAELKDRRRSIERTAPTISTGRRKA